MTTQETKPVKHRKPKEERKVLVWCTVKRKYWSEAQKELKELLKKYR